MITEMHNTTMEARIATTHQFIFSMPIRKVIPSAFTRLFESIFTEVNTTKTTAKEQGGEDIKA